MVYYYSVLVFIVVLCMCCKLTIVYAESTSLDGSAEETAESFAFALVNGSHGVFEVRGRRVRDFRLILSPLLFAILILISNFLLGCRTSEFFLEIENVAYISEKLNRHVHQDQLIQEPKSGCTSTHGICKLKASALSSLALSSRESISFVNMSTLAESWWSKSDWNVETSLKLNGDGTS
jgi:hypothetical protein